MMGQSDYSHLPIGIVLKTFPTDKFFSNYVYGLIDIF